MSPSARSLALRLLRPRRGALMRVGAWSAAQAAPAFASGLLVSAALDRGFLAGRPGTGLLLLGALAAVAIVSAVATRGVFPWLAQVAEPARDDLLRAVASGALGTAVAAGRPPSGAVARLTEQVESVRQLVSALLRGARQLVVPIVAALAGMAALDPLVAAVVAPMILLALLGYALSLRGLVVRQRRVVLAGEALADVAETAMGGARDIQACAAEERAVAAVVAAAEHEAAAAVALARAGVVRLLTIAVGAQAPLLAVIALAPSLLASGRLTVGEAAGAVTYMITALDPALRAIVQAGGTWISNLAVTLGRLAEVAGTAAAPAGGASRRPAGSELEMQDVSFSYSVHSRPVLRRLSATVPAGAHVAVVGPSGSGKSTLAALLAGMLAPGDGVVRLGGVDVGAVGERTLRNAVALIPQDAYVFAGSVRENLAYLRPDASAEDLERTVAELDLTALVARLGGLDATVAPGGAGLSAGERQLIAVARAHLAGAPVIVLDEATCHLDPAHEARAEQALARLGGTLVVVAHRITSALRADRVLVLDGDAALLGTHRELLDRSPLYADLVGHWNAPAVAR